jgi:hypothetical protein
MSSTEASSFTVLSLPLLQVNDFKIRLWSYIEVWLFTWSGSPPEARVKALLGPLAFKVLNRTRRLVALMDHLLQMPAIIALAEQKRNRRVLSETAVLHTHEW